MINFSWGNYSIEYSIRYSLHASCFPCTGKPLVTNKQMLPHVE